MWATPYHIGYLIQNHNFRDGHDVKGRSVKSALQRFPENRVEKSYSTTKQKHINLTKHLTLKSITILPILLAL
jgi:hypothetical protein